ncbi:hypothetical protein DHB64_15690 [Antarcticibacterium sp. W02-3]|nr:hypothetical protein [Antarcticibacterium sp. W02-3]MCM4161335.1 hypothetical protein [Antarcticibacterium sp. W02-3]
MDFSGLRRSQQFGVYRFLFSVGALIWRLFLIFSMQILFNHRLFKVDLNRSWTEEKGLHSDLEAQRFFCSPFGG